MSNETRKMALYVEGISLSGASDAFPYSFNFSSATLDCKPCSLDEDIRRSLTALLG